MSASFSRRTLARLLGAGALATTLPPAAHAEPPIVLGGPATFPPGFLWGSATAAYQVEGAASEDGRGPSIWDTFSHIPGKVNNNDTGDVADDFYHRYRDDIALMRDLGLKTFRFSISWSRVFPTGIGPANPKGLDFYNRLVDALLAAGIQPYCTLFHWDLPQALEDRGGWRVRGTPQAFADYAGYVSKRLSDRVQRFMTMNEIRSFTEIGYRDGVHAPGLKLPPGVFSQICHHAILGHGLAVQAIRANAKPGTQVGLADNATAVCPVFASDENVGAARRAMREENAPYLTAIMEGQYTDLYLRKLGADAPRYTPEDMKTIASPLDFVGLNVYAPQYVRADGSPQGYATVWPGPTFPRMASPWLYVGPESLYWSPKLVNELWHPKAIYITENGASADDRFAADGLILDTDRTMYLRNYLTQLHRAVAEGVPVRGYFLWSLLDNFEWADGYSKRFGIVYVDFKTQKRTAKLSAEFYKQTIARNTVA